jgi:hypothetical protein
MASVEANEAAEKCWQQCNLEMGKDAWADETMRGFIATALDDFAAAAVREERERCAKSQGLRAGLRRAERSDTVTEENLPHPIVIRCAWCKNETDRPGQWLDPDTFACSQECRKALMEKQSYDDLAASGGIVDAP